MFTMKLSQLLVRDVMLPGTLISKGTSISEAVQMLEDHELLSVVDQDGKLVGAFNESSLFKLVKHEPSLIGDPLWFDHIDPKIGQQPVESIMTTKISTVSLKDNLASSIKVMNSMGYRAIHVVDSQYRLLGVVRMRDIFLNLFGEGSENKKTGSARSRRKV